ncbi:MAG: hypothetical protein JW832_08110 [Deltaproteobacteria bacterium]|nr:hypothetical protein [Deltaproteobacteria bacterium]
MKAACVFTFIMCAAMLCPASAVHAITDNLTRSQVREALEFGRANQRDIEKTLMSLYGCGPASPEVVVRTRWCKLALLAGIKAQQGKAVFTAVSTQEQEAILQDPTLQIDITVHGPSIEFARSYTVHALQDGRKIVPEIFHADHFQESPHIAKTDQGFCSYYATIRAYFKYDTIALQRPFSIVVVKPQGSDMYEINPLKFK